MLAVPRLVATREAEVDQRVQVAVGHGVHVPSASAVAAVGSAERYEFLATKAHAAVTAITRGDVNVGFVDKLHGMRNLSGQKSQQKSPGMPGLLSKAMHRQAALTLTVRRLRSPFTAKLTCPSTSANKV